ncbi:MAG: hypothetical protein KAI22_11180 [Gammaproteobacteria bacterium]|nr:hypothetical protein [Gammaproteobacteria bacterium]
MILFRQIKKRTLFLWVLLLSTALLFAQSMTLHVHTFDHEQEYSHDSTEVAIEHIHLTEAHLSTDISHGDEHDQIMSEVDVSQDGLMKKVSSNLIMLALFTIVLTILTSHFYLRIFYRYRDNDAAIPWRYLLSPPLRAPPF